MTRANIVDRRRCEPDERQRHIAQICELIREAGLVPKDFFYTQPPAPDPKDEAAFTRWLERERQRRPIAHSMACYGLTAHDLAECWPHPSCAHVV